MTEDTRALSIGAVVGGNTLANERWRDGIRHVMRRIAAVSSDTTSPVNVNVVFHVPGDILQPDFSGVRTGSYRRRDSLLMVQAAVPSDPPTDVEGALLALVLDGIAEAERWAQRRRYAQDLQQLRAMVSRA